jgi:CheY-like chemotaxis protein
VVRQENEMRILAVDDDVDFLAVLRAKVGELGVKKIVCATNARDAFRAIASDTFGFDCILLDIKMPDMDGVELCRRIRCIEKCRSVPIIMLTSLGNRDWIFSAFEAGATDYVTKPLDTIELAARLISSAKMNALRKSGQLPSELGAETALDVPVSVLVDQVPNVMNFLNLQNMVFQLGRLDLLFLNCFAISFLGFRSVRYYSDQDEFVGIVNDIAELIQDSCNAKNLSLSYSEDGVFVGVGEFSHRNAAIKIRKQLNDQLVKRPPRYIDGQPVPLEFEILTGSRLALQGPRAAVDTIIALEDTALAYVSRFKEAV